MNHKALLILFILIPFPIFSLAHPLQAAENKTKERLAVLDLDHKFGVEKGIAEALSVIVRDKIHSFGEYQVMSPDDIQAVASREQLKQAMGCDDSKGECLVDFGRRIDSRFMVAGDISKLGTTYIVSLRILDTKGDGAGVINRVSEKCKCDEDTLINTVEDVVAKLLRKPTTVNKVKEEMKNDENKFKLDELTERYKIGHFNVRETILECRHGQHSKKLFTNRLREQQKIANEKSKTLSKGEIKKHLTQAKSEMKSFQDELLAPILKRLESNVEKFADENNYDIVFDGSDKKGVIYRKKSVTKDEYLSFLNNSEISLSELKAATTDLKTIIIKILDDEI